ncbi:MAG: glycosyltransferase family 2 protein [Puniceicoccaceae bacterium]
MILRVRDTAFPSQTLGLLPNEPVSEEGFERVLLAEREWFASQSGGLRLRWIVPCEGRSDPEWSYFLSSVALHPKNGVEICFWASDAGEFSRKRQLWTLGELGAAMLSLEEMAENLGWGDAVCWKIGKALGDHFYEASARWTALFPIGCFPHPRTGMVLQRCAEGELPVTSHWQQLHVEESVTFKAMPEAVFWSKYGYNSFGPVVYIPASGWFQVMDCLGKMDAREAGNNWMGHLIGMAIGRAVQRIPLAITIAVDGTSFGMAPMDRWKHLYEDALAKDLCGDGAPRGRLALEVVGGNRRYPRYEERKEGGKIGLVIPFRDALELTTATLKSLARLDGADRLEIVLVDNRSEKSNRVAIERVLEEFFQSNQRTVIEDDGPFNFARLNNRGIERLATEKILLCNNDIEVLDDHVLMALEQLVDLPRVAMAGPGVYYPDGRMQSAGIFEGPNGPQASSLIVEEDADAFREVEGLTFAFVMVRRDALVQVGGLDEKICPNGFGDALICHRLRKRGWCHLVDPRLRVVHHESQSRGRRPEEIERWQMVREGMKLGGFQTILENGIQPQTVRKGSSAGGKPALSKRIYRCWKAARRSWTESR